ncbi:MAG TPA: glycosyltransferase family 4 protein [Bacteroidota bacterium]|nr:glycosyltransferase family 4 protein [Bacteroidota bacterium]
MRALHLCTSEAWGGLELYACTLMFELQNAGVQIVAICKRGSKAEAFLRGRGVEVLHGPGTRLLSLDQIRWVRRLVRDRDIDVVHVHYHRDIWPASLALMRDPARRLILSIYMGVPAKRDPIHRFIFGRVDAFLTSSKDLNSRLPYLYAAPPERIHFLPYGRPLAQYRRDENKRRDIRARHGVKPGDILIGTMVRIDPGKGVMDFARSFPYIEKNAQSRVVYMIVGEPTRKGLAAPRGSLFEKRSEAYLRELQSFISQERLGDRILLVGFQDDMIGYLSAFDVFVFPSRDELYSLVVLDAMGMELPVLAARAGGNLYQVTDGVNGLLYAVADSRDLAAKLSRYLLDPVLRRQHGKTARAGIVQNHDMKQTISSLLKIYSDRPDMQVRSELN